jgi:hypothetical protein
VLTLDLEDISISFLHVRALLSKVAVLAPTRHASATSLGLALFCSLSSVALIAS